MNQDGTNRLRNGVRTAYSAAAERPQAEHPFPVGRRFAESLGYPKDLLDDLPSCAIDAFSGVSSVAIFADIPLHSIVLDLGCGAGFDSLIAARRVSARGRIIGIDFSTTMLDRARQASAESGADNITFYRADAEKLPLAASEIDIALINGIFNLNPQREAIFRELARVVRSGGAVYAAELILKEPLPPEIRTSEADWFA